MPATSPTLSPTLSAMVAGLRGSSSGIPVPPVEPGKPLLKVYTCSKINLNISLKGIEGGTPQRVMDIMGAGGFMMTNYCAETAELFEEDK